jgi:hypothetical protein
VEEIQQKDPNSLDYQICITFADKRGSKSMKRLSNVISAAAPVAPSTNVNIQTKVPKLDGEKMK